VANNFGFAQGFDLYLRPKVMRRRPGLAQKNPSASRLPGTDQDVTHSAMQFLQSPQARDRFFLYLHYMDVHQYVYDNGVDFGTSFSDIYDNSIRWVDANVGTLVATLQNEELMERTLLVIASDHGEAFHEHGREGHARDIHRETTHVPLLLALPFRLSEGIVVESPVENVDIWPTLLDLLGLPSLRHVDGRSLVPLIEAAARGEERPDERLRFAYLDQNWGVRNSKPDPIASVGDGRYRLLRGAKNVQLFDVQSDPNEKRNLAAAQPEVVERLEVLLREHLSGPEPEWGPPQHVELSDMELGQLRALGYALPEQEAEAGDADGGQPGPK
jgi:arylsulfatase A-like enzyme